MTLITQSSIAWFQSLRKRDVGGFPQMSGDLARSHLRVRYWKLYIHQQGFNYWTSSKGDLVVRQLFHDGPCKSSQSFLYGLSVPPELTFNLVSENLCPVLYQKIYYGNRVRERSWRLHLSVYRLSFSPRLPEFLERSRMVRLLDLNSQHVHFYLITLLIGQYNLSFDVSGTPESKTLQFNFYRK